MLRPDGSLFIAERHGKPIEAYHVAQGDTQDCGPHATAIAVNFWHGRPALDARTLAQEMNRPRLRRAPIPLVVRRIPNWATFPWGIVDVLREHGLQARWRMLAREEDLHRALREDHIVMAIFGEPLRHRGWRLTGWSHVAILAGWEPSAQQYSFVDSASIYPLKTRPRDEFRRYWRNMGRILIEAF